MNNLPEVKQEGFVESYQSLYRLAELFSKSSMIPAQYKNNAADCMIALNMAQRSGMEPVFVMQNMYVVKGHPSWSGQACIAMLRNCGLFRDVRPIYNAERTACYFQATDAKTGETLTGTTVSLDMAAREGWSSNSKWKSMPEQMLAYRAASFFARLWCPEVLMGCMVEGEADDAEQNREPISDPLAELDALEPPAQETTIAAQAEELESQVEFDEAEL